MYEHNALGYWSSSALCLTKVRSSRARCPATALILLKFLSVLCFCLCYVYASLLCLCSNLSFLSFLSFFCQSSKKQKSRLCKKSEVINFKDIQGKILHHSHLKPSNFNKQRSKKTEFHYDPYTYEFMVIARYNFIQAYPPISSNVCKCPF